MLVLSRRVGETIVINDNVRITVASVQGNKIGLAVDAPPEVRVDREEVHRRRAGLDPAAPAARPWRTMTPLHVTLRRARRPAAAARPGVSPACVVVEA